MVFIINLALNISKRCLREHSLRIQCSRLVLNGNETKNAKTCLLIRRNLKLHEFTSYALMKQYGINVPTFGLAHNKQEAIEIAKKLELKDILIKAQILSDERARGHFVKSGLKRGIHFALTPEQCGEIVEKMIGDRLVTRHTPPEGMPVNQVMITQRRYPRRELYFGIKLDILHFEGINLFASTQGGFTYSSTMRDNPSLMFAHPIDITQGLNVEDAKQLCRKVGLFDKGADVVADYLMKLYKLFIEKDGMSIEMNPFVEDVTGEWCCLNAEMYFDNNSAFRQEELFKLVDTSQYHPMEVLAHDKPFSYLFLQGDIGLLVNGSGLAMATMDLLTYHHGDAACFLDLGGKSTIDNIKDAFLILTKDKKVDVILINIYAGIMRCDYVAEGIVAALKEVKTEIPVVCRLMVKYALKGTRFESVEAVKEKAACVLKELTEDYFQHCFQQWKIRMERCTDKEEVYIEGDNK